MKKQFDGSTKKIHQRASPNGVTTCIQKQRIRRYKIKQNDQVKHESKGANKKPRNKQTKKQQLLQQQQQQQKQKNTS